jgi:uncharacterized membrane protein
MSTGNEFPVVRPGFLPQRRRLREEEPAKCASVPTPPGISRESLRLETSVHWENMKTETDAAPPAPGSPDAATAGSEHDQVDQNIAAVLDFYTREDEKISQSQRILERVSDFIGQPVFLGIILSFVALWTIANTVLRQLGITEFDSPPFFWLQGILGLGALLTATVVLIKQNRLFKLSEQRAHLELKVALLTEQKAAKLIDLLEELRRDLPNVRDRHESDAAALQQSMNPDKVLAALDERAEPEDPSKPAGKDAKDAAARK